MIATNESRGDSFKPPISIALHLDLEASTSPFRFVSFAPSSCRTELVSFGDPLLAALGTCSRPIRFFFSLIPCAHLHVRITNQGRGVRFTSAIMASRQDQVIDDDEPDTCPLCIEELDLSDRGFRPCPCGYQVCDNRSRQFLLPLHANPCHATDMPVLLQQYKNDNERTLSSMSEAV